MQKRMIVGISLFLSLACGGRVPPNTLSISPGFDEVQVAAIHDARDQWCEAVGWCPSFVEWFPLQRGGIVASHRYDQLDTLEGSSAFNNSDWIVIDADGVLFNDVDTFTHIILHELKHWW